jgi:hypothetical protein
VSACRERATQQSLQLNSTAPARKELLIDLADLGPRTIDSIEGTTWGPRLPDGRRSLVSISDDNFSPIQATHILTLAMK